MSRHPENLACERVLDLLEPFIDGDLAERLAAQVERHVALCPACAEETELAERIRAELRSMPRPDTPGAVVERVIAKARGTRRSEARWSWRTLRPSPVWAAAAALVLAALLAPVWLGSPPAPGVERSKSPAALEPDELERATREVRVALAYVGRATRRTGLEIRDGLIVERLVLPTVEGLTSLNKAPGNGAQGEGNET